MLSIFTTVLLCCSTSLADSSTSDTRSELLSIVPIPKLSFKTGMGFNLGDSITLHDEHFTIRKRIAVVQKQLKKQPANLGLLAELANLYWEAEDNTKLAQVDRKLTRHLQAALAGQPRDESLLLIKGTVVERESVSKAVKLYQQIVRLQPKCSEAWCRLGKLFEIQAFRFLIGNGKSVSIIDLYQLLGKLDTKTITQKLEESQKKWDLAFQCHRNAMSFSNKVSVYCLEYARCQAVYSGTVATVKSRTTKEQVRIAEAWFSPDLFPLFQKAVRLSPQNPQVVGMALLYPLLCLHARQIDTARLSVQEHGDDLASRAREMIKDNLQRLKKLAKCEDHEIAGTALSMLGRFYFLSNNFPEAISLFKGAVQCNPNDSYSCYLLAGCLGVTGKDKELIALCQKQLQHEDTSRIRVVIAKAYLKTNQPEKAIQVLRNGLKSATEPALVQLMLNAVILKSNPPESGLQDMRKSLENVKKSLSVLSAKHQRDYHAIFAIHLALTKDRDAAIDYLSTMSESCQKDAVFLQILTVLHNKHRAGS